MNTDIMFSSATDQWATPQDFFDKLNEEFHFTLDVAADESNHKCEKYYDKMTDGLAQPWTHTHTPAKKLFGVIPHMAEKLVNG